MEDPKRQVRKLTRTHLVIEVVRDINTPCAFLQVIISLPGDRGTKPYTWLLDGGVFTAEQFKDMTGVIEREMVDSFAVSHGGIQGLLPM